MIENEVTLPVSFNEIESNERIDKATQEEQWTPDFDALSCGGEQKEKKEVVDYSKNFLPSSILDSDQKQLLFKGYKEILGAQSKGFMNKTLNGTWKCIHTVTEKMGQPQ